MQQGGTIVSQFDANTSECVLRVDRKPPPIEWGVPLSEWAHMTRSALDNLFTQVIWKTAGNAPSRKERLGFPIHKDKGSFDDLKVQMWVNQLPKGDRTFIEEAQPYKAGDPWREREPLALLNELNNIDKHGFFQISFVAMMLQVIDHQGHGRKVPMSRDWVRFIRPGMSWVPGLPVCHGIRCEVTQWSFTSGESDDRAEIARATVTNTGDDPQVEMQPAPLLAICVSHRDVPLVVADLFVIRHRVHEIVDHFRPLF